MDEEESLDILFKVEVDLQQAIEKYLKHIYSLQEQEPNKDVLRTHNLFLLLRHTGVKISKSDSALLKSIKDSYYSNRYLDIDSEYSEEDEVFVDLKEYKSRVEDSIHLCIKIRETTLEVIDKSAKRVEERVNLIRNMTLE